MKVLTTANEAYRSHTEATGIHTLLGSLYQLGIIAQAQIVVGTEVQTLLTLNDNFGTLSRFNDAFFFIQTIGLDLGDFLFEIILKFCIHTLYRIYKLFERKSRINPSFGKGFLPKFALRSHENERLLTLANYSTLFRFPSEMRNRTLKIASSTLKKLQIVNTPMRSHYLTAGGGILRPIRYFCSLQAIT